jgi:hypothetical protein
MRYQGLHARIQAGRPVITLFTHTKKQAQVIAVATGEGIEAKQIGGTVLGAANACSVAFLLPPALLPLNPLVFQIG